MNETHPVDRFVRWAQAEPTVLALVSIGSRVRADGEASAADGYSDWDFQVVTRRPALFADRVWVRAAGLGEPLAYAARLGRLGRAAKVSAIFREVELDLVLLPATPLRLARGALALSLVPHLTRVRAALGDLALVLRPGFRVLKGEATWGRFFRRVATEIPLPRLDDAAVRDIAEGFVCDYVSTRQKIARGEFAAAQRWLHGQLAEANFKLLHELRQRRGEPSFPDARRMERVVGEAWRQALTIHAAPDAPSLLAAAERSAEACRELMRGLVGPAWCWPAELPSGLRGE